MFEQCLQLRVVQRALQRGCDADYGSACRQLGDLGESNDPASALAFWGRACALEDARGCDALGVARDHGTGAPEDLPGAREAFAKACDLGAASGCRNRGILLEHGRGGPADADGARAAYRLACDGDDGSGCTRLSLLLAEAPGADPAQCAALVAKACELGDKALSDALDKLDDCDEETFRDAQSIIELLRENLALWKDEEEN